MESNKIRGWELTARKEEDFGHPLLPAVYGLNKSYTKKLLIGLEAVSLGERFKPVARLVGNDNKGVAFEPEDWEEFKGLFEDIVKYFEGNANGLMDQRYFGRTWLLKFSFSHGERAVVLESNYAAVKSDGVSKKFTRAIILKKVSFDTLCKFVCMAVDERFNFLKSVCEFASCVVRDLISKLKNEAGLVHDAQIQMYNESLVAELGKSLNVSVADCEKIVESVKIDSRKLSGSETFVLINEVLGLLPSKIVVFLNSTMH